MANHVHVVVGVPGDPEPERLLADFKAWGTRRLNRGWGRREHWWTQGGSRRRKKAAAALRAAIEYVRDQPRALVVWLDPEAITWLDQRSGATPEKASGATSVRRCSVPPAD
jgi:hypothetical protein